MGTTFKASGQDHVIISPFAFRFSLFELEALEKHVFPVLSVHLHFQIVFQIGKKIQNNQKKMDQLAAKLFKIEAVKFGSFTLKSGLISPIYFDLRVVISYPSILEEVASLLWERSNQKSAELVCGVPYTALPIATLISVKNGIPMLLRRKEAKGYGTKKLIEGDYENGQSCLIIEDVVTSGTSILETAQELRKIGLKVTDAVVMLDRMQGARENLTRNGIDLRSVFKIDEFMLSLEKQGFVTKSVVEQVSQFIAGSSQEPILCLNPRLTTPLEQRLTMSKHPVASKLFQLMISKQSNLCVAADLSTLDEVIVLAEKIGQHIIVLKIHVDIYEDFSEAKILRLKEIAKAQNFLIMEDRKFADIANTVQRQFSGGIYKIGQWADLVTAHSLAGPEMISHLSDQSDSAAPTCGCVLILEMSTKNSLTTPEYCKESAKRGIAAAGVVGFVGQSPLDEDSASWIQFTPGVNATAKGDDKGQQYCSPTEAVVAKGADIIIVGRGLILSADVVATARAYRQEGWSALQQRIVPSS